MGDRPRVSDNPLHVLTPRPMEMNRLIREYGPFVQGSVCPTCAGRGSFWWYDADNQIVEWECNCDEQLILYRWFLARGIRPLYQRLGWKDLTGINRQSWDKVHEWLALLEAFRLGAGPSIWMSGTRGTGKTLVASLIQRKLLSQGIECWQVDAQHIGSMMTSWREEDTKEWWVRRIRPAPVLVIDDLGREKGNEEWVQARVIEVARFRLESMLPTIITGNFTMEQAQMKYGSEFTCILEGADKHEFISGEVLHRQMNETLQQRLETPLSAPIVFG